MHPAQIAPACYAGHSMKILFVTSNRLGDAVLTTGLLDHLIRTYPRARITVATGPIAAGVFTHMPQLDRLIVFRKKSYDRHWIPLWWFAARQVWDLVVDIRASAISYLVPTKRRAVMRPRPGRKIEQLGAILRLSPPPMPVAWTSAEDHAHAATLLPPGSPNITPIITLGPTASRQIKMWPADKFAALFHALASGPLPNARAAILAGPGKTEEELSAPLRAALPDAIDLRGHLTIPQVTACLQRSALYIGNDSGLMHLAAAAGVPTLGLFGPTPWREYSPAGPRTIVAVSPTGPMEDLSVDLALQAAITLLGATQVASLSPPP